MDAQVPLFPSNAAPLEIGMVLYPGMTLLDLAGPELTAAALRMMGAMNEAAVEIARTRRKREPA